MNKVLNYMIIAGIAILAISCAEPTDPTPTQMAYGEWVVKEYFVDGQESSGAAISRLNLERDASYVLVDNNGFISVGNWTATETKLTLSEADSTAGGTVYDFGIVYQTFDKMQLLQTISNPTAGDIQIRYLMNRATNGSTY